MPSEKIVISLKRFLLIEQCPADWQHFDLYLFRDDAVAFYVGQSQLAFARVWEHLLGGFHGHSIVGRFVWCNWPTSMRFTIELLSSQSEPFNSVENDLNAAERLLIQQGSPCFNISLNGQPTPLPSSYFSANAKIHSGRSLNKLIREAERAVRQEDDRSWLQALEK